MRRSGILAVCGFSIGLSPLFAEVQANVYSQKILVANRAGFEDGAFIDEHLINPWGIALRPPGAGGHFWISNAGSASSSTYIGDAHGIPLHQDGLKVVYLHGPLVSYEDGLANVTGQVYNAASDFPNQPVEFPVSGPADNLTKESPVSIGTISGSAKFVFVTTDGTINAWRSGTAASMNAAIIVKDYSVHGADKVSDLRYTPAFTGVAMSTNAQANNRLYVSDFQNSTIRVLDNQWKDITANVPFARPAGMPADYSPFNIQLLDGRLYVAFAALDLNSDEPGTDVPAPGAGRVVAYDLNGKIVQEFADAGRLNSPWGVAIAPKNFGAFSGTLLVGNFGDGTIAAFDLTTGAFRDYLRNAAGEPIVLDGLWGLAFGNGVSLGDVDSLYFAAGPNSEQDGIFGRLRYAGPAIEQAAPKPVASVVVH
ncbi:MAG: TIGR03118 family protein [Nibricoccus sp.]